MGQWGCSVGLEGLNERLHQACTVWVEGVWMGALTRWRLRVEGVENMCDLLIMAWRLGWRCILYTMYGSARVTSLLLLLLLCTGIPYIIHHTRVSSYREGLGLAGGRGGIESSQNKKPTPPYVTKYSTSPPVT